MTDNLFITCMPRADVMQGSLKESDFAADLAQVLRGQAPDEYKKPVLFFGNTYPTRGIKTVLKLVAQRVLGRPEQIGAIFRLGMAMHRKYPRRVLMALRFLLIEPQ